MKKDFGKEWRKQVEKLTKKEIIDLFQKDGQERSKIHAVQLRLQSKTNFIRKQSRAKISHQITDKVQAELFRSMDYDMPVIEIKDGSLKGNTYMLEVKDLMELINRLVRS